MKYSTIISIEEIEAAENSKFWKAVTMLVLEWLTDIHVELEDLSKENTLADFKWLAGNAQTARRILIAPEMLKDYIKQEYLENRKEDEDGDI